MNKLRSVRAAAHRFYPVLLAASLAAGCQTPVLHNLPEADTNRAIAVLQEQGIMASKQPDNLEGGTWKVMVPRSDVVKVWSVLQQYRLPASPGRERLTASRHRSRSFAASPRTRSAA